MSIESSAPIEEDFSNLPAIPEITFEDCADPESRKLSTYLADWKLGSLNSDDKTKLRNANGRLRQEALVYTIYFQQFAKEHQTTGISAKAFAKTNPIDLPPSDKKKAIRKFLLPASFSRRLQIYLDYHKAATIADVDVTSPTVPILELSDDRYINPGAPFTMTDGATILALAGIHWFRGLGYKSLHKALKKIMAKPDFPFRDAWKCPTTRQIRTFLEQVPDAMLLYLSRGHKKMYARYGFAQMRDYGDFNAWWAGDAFCMRDVFFYDPARPEGKRVFQPWVAFMLECSSRYCVSLICHQEASNSLHGLELIRTGILPSDDPDFIKLAYGIPERCQMDNRPPLGNELVEQICKRLEIKYLPINPGMSAMNGIAERAVGTFKGYIRTALRARLEAAFGKMGRRQPIPISQWSQFCQIVREAIYFDYHHTPHAELNKETPYEACGRLMTANPPQEVDRDQIIRYTSYMGAAKMQKKGIYALGKWYLNEAKFDGLEGRTVEWVIDPLNPDKGAEIIYQGELVCVAPLHVPVGDHELRRSLKESSQKLKGEMRKTRDALYHAIGALQGVAPTSLPSRPRQQAQSDPSFEVPTSLGQLPDLFGKPGNAS